MAKPRKITDLNRIYSDTEDAQRSLFAEQRSNVLLTLGEHYSKRGAEFWSRLRNNAMLNKSQRLRITKNHIQKIVKSYVNNIMSHAPGVMAAPKNPTEFSDQKSAEMHQSVWMDLKNRHSLKKLFRLLCQDYITVGEAWAKIFFDPEEGQFLGMELEHDDDGGTKKSRDGEPVVLRHFTGDVVFERILGFNVLVDPAARSYEEARYVIVRKMVDTEELKEQFKDDEDKLKAIHESEKQTYQLFSWNGYQRSKKDQTLVREFYFKPTSEYPNGYYYIATEEGILFEGELPHGIFPICHVGFDEATTSPRSFSIIKQLRPYQAEINRAASKIAEHQVTLGDDKLVVQAGASVNPGGTAHGIKVLKSTAPVTHLPGRSGDQYLNYLQFQIEQMYFVGNVSEDGQQKDQGNLDPYTMLFRSIRNKKAFTTYAEKFEEFIKEIAWKSLKFAKKNYSQKMVVQIVDKKERVNIADFKSSDDLSWEIVLEPVTEDVESKMGRQIALNHIIQFAGNQLTSGDIGRFIKNMPFVNEDEISADLTIDSDNVLSDIVAMDKGRFAPANPRDNHEYYTKRLIHRMKMKDFQFLPVQVQQMYALKLQQHEQFLIQQQQAAAQASSGFIPSGGFLVTTDIRVPRADDPTRTERAKVPVEALAWLIDTLEKQGQSQALLQSLPGSAQADIGGAMAAQAPNQGQ